MLFGIKKAIRRAADQSPVTDEAPLECVQALVVGVEFPPTIEASKFNLELCLRDGGVPLVPLLRPVVEALDEGVRVQVGVKLP